MTGVQTCALPIFLTINSLIEETNSDKKEFLAWAGVNKVEDITNEAVGTCLNMLNKKKKLKEKQEKEQQLKKQQEIQQRELEQHKEDFEF